MHRVALQCDTLDNRYTQGVLTSAQILLFREYFANRQRCIDFNSITEIEQAENRHDLFVWRTQGLL